MKTVTVVKAQTHLDELVNALSEGPVLLCARASPVPPWSA